MDASMKNKLMNLKMTYIDVVSLSQYSRTELAIIRRSSSKYYQFSAILKQKSTFSHYTNEFNAP